MTNVTIENYIEAATLIGTRCLKMLSPVALIMPIFAVVVIVVALFERQIASWLLSKIAGE